MNLFFILVIFLCANTQAETSALGREVQDAINAVNDAKIIDEQLYLIKVQYHEDGLFYTTKTVNFTASDTEAGGIVKIISGYITQDDLLGNANGNFTQELISSSDVDHFGVEVQFADYVYLPSAVRSKKVLFLALGLGSNPAFINKQSLSGGDVTNRSISDFTCVNPSTSLNNNTTNPINEGRPLGTVSIGSGSNATTNILRRVNNSFRKCHV